MVNIRPNHKNFMYHSRSSYATDKKEQFLNDTLDMKLAFLVAETLQEGGGKTEDSGELKMKMLKFGMLSHISILTCRIFFVRTRKLPLGMRGSISHRNHDR